MADFLPEPSEGKNVNAFEAKPKKSIGVCVANVASTHKIVRSQEWLENPRQKKLSGKDVTISKEPIWPGKLSHHELDKRT